MPLNTNRRTTNISKRTLSQDISSGRPGQPRRMINAIIDDLLSKDSVVDDGDERIPLCSDRPNVLITFVSTLYDVLHSSSPFLVGRLFWERDMVHRAWGRRENNWMHLPIDDRWWWKMVPYLFATTALHPECRLNAGFKSFCDDLSAHVRRYGPARTTMLEVTLTREEPLNRPSRVKIVLESSVWARPGACVDGNELGEWWMSNMRPVQDEDTFQIVSMLDQFTRFLPGEPEQEDELPYLFK